ncbi:MAG: tRNA delta(2)-isopentenylpyrophosphate transferase [uncultured bacterium]|nr:MAG: tRNA delta(2)-isopentenylpyrophosphate transferase [uncultured bacterium]
MPKSISKTLVVCGPTASGKTSLALSVAENLLRRHPSVNILSADSRQVYRDLDIVTGKDIPESLSPRIKLFGLDLVEADKIFNLSDFVNYSRKIIQNSIKENTPLIIVGGTGLYLKAITSDLLNVHVPPNQPLRRDLEKLDLLSLQSRLSKLNPRRFATLNNSDLNNPRRLIRAIEVSSSARPSHPVGESLPVSETTFVWIGLRQDKEVQKAAIRRRVLDRLDSGAIQEVESLLKRFPDQKLPVFTSLGVQEIIKFLHQEISRETLVDLWTASEMDYARRQMVWFRKQPGIVWYDKDKVDQVLIGSLAKYYSND